MKKLLLITLSSLALVRLASGQDNSYVNDGLALNVQVDAINFTNNGEFDTSTANTPFDFSDVVNYTNRGLMQGNIGFIFDTAPAGNVGARHMAASWGNANAGMIFGGSGVIGGLNPPAQIQIPPTLSPQIRISATNTVNSGLVDVGMSGLISVSGGIVKLNRGTTHVEGFGDAVGTGTPLGVFDNFWGVGSTNNVLFAGNILPPSPFSPATPVSDILGAAGIQVVTVPNALIYVETNIITSSNLTYQYVFVVDDNNPGNSTNLTPQIDVRFLPFGDFAIPIVQWLLATTDPSGQPVTNTLFLADAFAVETNAPLLVNNGFSVGGQPQPGPTNYTYFTAFGGFATLPKSNATFDPNVIVSNAFSTNAPFSVSNDFSIWGVNVQDVTFRPEPRAANQSFSNIPGRIEITADTSLDLTRAHITGPNFLKVTATNHFVGAANAQIVFPFASFNLGSTNGQLAITNLVAPFIPRITGPIDAWSARWTNTVMSNAVSTNGVGTNATVTTNAVTITNRFHVLLVHSALSPTTGVSIENFTLRSTNVVISDVLQVESNLLIDAQNLTITSNAPGAVTPLGEIILLSRNILWSSSLPTLQNLTNFGLISTLNSVFFQKRLTPDSPSPSDGPYQTFVNHGSISTGGGETIWANYFENSGPSGANPSIAASFGLINVQAANALITNGTFTASAGDITLGGSNIIIGNQTLTAPAGALTLIVTNQLTDGSTVGNIFTISDGINLPIKPATGDLLGTTVIIQCPAGAEVEDVWAGADLGAIAAGYSNNAALGHLVLLGGDVNSAFHFAAAGAQNALYVDQLEFQGSTSNAAALDIDANMTIYFASALKGSNDISGILDGANGGRLRKVPGFVGLFKTGSSSGGGMHLAITTTNVPPMEALISWQAAPNATNGLYSSTSVNGSNWTLVTNLVQGASSSVVTVPQPIQANGPVFYKVRINPIH